MIGDGWDGDPSIRPSSEPETTALTRRRVCVVTGSRAEYGLLRPVMRAIHARQELELAVIAAGSHLILPAETFREVKADFAIADIVPMQMAGQTGRMEDAASVGRGVGRFARAFERLRPDWVVVLGDRIEAFAAAASASIAGFAVAHLHGGDRAEGVADEAMRHAITKLAHLHLAATQQSADRIVRMGERPEMVKVVGSPAIDELGGMAVLDDEAFAALGSPRAVILMHPVGRSNELEEAEATTVIEGVVACMQDDSRNANDSRNVLALFPNHDAGREGIVRAIQSTGVRAERHLWRDVFVGLLKRLAIEGGVMVGNSSAGLIEASALGLAVVNVGHRQAGRERAGNVVSVDHATPEALRSALQRAMSQRQDTTPSHPYGDGRSGEHAARHLVEVHPHDPAVLRKQNAY